MEPAEHSQRKYGICAQSPIAAATEITEIEAEMKPFGPQDPHCGDREWRRLNDKRLALQVEAKRLEPDVAVLGATVKSMGGRI